MGQAGAIGVVYTLDERQTMGALEITSTEVNTTIQDRLAITRVDQVFTNDDSSLVQGIYEFKLPADATITDLVLWIEGRPIRGLILEKVVAQRSYQAIVEGRADPALIEKLSEELFRLSIYPFAPGGSRRVEIEYMQVLQAQGTSTTYRLPLSSAMEPAPQIGRLTVQIDVETQQEFVVSVADGFGLAPEISHSDAGGARLGFSGTRVAATADLIVEMAPSGDRLEAVALSFYPDAPGAEGYFALWLPPVAQQTQLTPVSVTLLIDTGPELPADDRAWLHQALIEAVLALPDDARLNISCYDQAVSALAAGPLPVTDGGRESAIEFLNSHLAPIPLSGTRGLLASTAAYVALHMAMSQPLEGRQHHIIFATADSLAFAGADANFAQQLGADGYSAPISTIGLGGAQRLKSLVTLAESSGGTALFPPDAAALSQWLQGAHQPWVAVGDCRFTGVVASALHGETDVRMLTGQEAFRVGRYTSGGPGTVVLERSAGDRDLSAEFPIELTPAPPPRLVDTTMVELLHSAFDDSLAAPWPKAPGTAGEWQITGSGGLAVRGADYISRAYAAVPDSAYTIETRVRWSGQEAKIIFHQADRSEGWRLDLDNSGSRARVSVGGIMGSWTRCLGDNHAWNDVRVEVGNGFVNTFINGQPVHRSVWIGGIVPDGVIGVGSYTGDAEFDFVRVTSLGEWRRLGEYENPIARLWARGKVDLLEEQNAAAGGAATLEEEILDLGLRYRLVTSRTSLLVLEEGVQVNPRLEAGRGPADGATTAVRDTVATRQWLGRTFRRQAEGVWLDAEFVPGMPRVLFDPSAAQPDAVTAFAALGEHLIVVLDGIAYEIVPADDEALPVLSPNVPNPFNAETTIRFVVPADLAGHPVELTIYNLAGQRVRRFIPADVQPGPGALAWNGLDESGAPVASGIYLCHLRVGRYSAVRKVLCVR